MSEHSTQSPKSSSHLPLSSLFISTFVMLGLAVMLDGCAEGPAAEFQQIPLDLKAAVEATDGQFMNRNAGAMGAIITDDFSGWSVTEEGPAIRVEGREQTVQMLSMFFENTNWVDSKTHMLGMVDNILIQVEDDTYETQIGRSTVRTLNLYEFKDGKRWRNWKFFPVKKE